MRLTEVLTVTVVSIMMPILFILILFGKELL